MFQAQGWSRARRVILVRQRTENKDFVTYNLVTLLQERMGAKIYRTLGTLRTQLFACGAIMGRSGRRTLLRISLTGPWRERFLEALGVFFPMEKPDCGAVETG